MKKTKSIIEELTKKELSKVRSKVSSYIERATLSLIGLEKKYSNNYEIDHCNGRNSILIDAFRNIASEEANKIAKSYNPTKEDISNWQLAFKNELNRQVGYAIKSCAENKANELAKEAIGKIKIDVDKILNEELGEIKKDLPF